MRSALPGLAVSKLVAGRPKDIEFVRVMIREHLTSIGTLHERIDAVASLDQTRRASLRTLVDGFAHV